MKRLLHRLRGWTQDLLGKPRAHRGWSQDLLGTLGIHLPHQKLQRVCQAPSSPLRGETRFPRTPWHHGGNRRPGLQNGLSPGGVPPYPVKPPPPLGPPGPPPTPLVISAKLSPGYCLGGWRQGRLQPLGLLGTWLGGPPTWVLNLHPRGLPTSLF